MLDYKHLVMKYDLSKMMGLDLYLSSLSVKECRAILAKISNNSKILTPLMSWDVYSQGYFSTIKAAERFQDIEKVKSYGQKLNWKNNMDAIFCEQPFEAIILTDINQNIIWVNKGFCKMTGYSKNEVLSKTPRMLQGNASSKEVKTFIREKLKDSVPFNTIITNYRKNGVPYDCEVYIFPLYNDSRKTHFLALERQLN